MVMRCSDRWYGAARGFGACMGGASGDAVACVLGPAPCLDRRLPPCARSAAATPDPVLSNPPPALPEKNRENHGSTDEISQQIDESRW
eukprot:1145673-Rhodomonas_salina.1